MPTYGDPVSSALNAFSSVVNTIEGVRDRRANREIRKQEAQFRSEQMGMERKRMKREEQKWGMEDEIGKILDVHPDLVRGAMALDQEESTALKEGRDADYTKHKDTILSLGLGGVMLDGDISKLDDKSNAVNKLSYQMNKIGEMVAGSKDGKVVIKREQVPDMFDNLEKSYEHLFNRGTDKWGNKVEDGVKKKVKAILVNKEQNPATVSFVLDVETPVREGQVFRHIGSGNPTFTVDTSAKGMIEQGNIDLDKRPVYRNATGDISTVRSISIEEDGGVVLIPSISDNGKKMSNEEAKKEYIKTRQHLGKFDSEENAQSYAEHLHSDPMWNEDLKAYDAHGKTSTAYEALSTYNSDPNTPVAQIPIPMLANSLKSNREALNRLKVLRAKMDPKQWLEEVSAKQAELDKMKKEKEKNTAINKAASTAMGRVDKGKSVNEQRMQFMEEMGKEMPGLEPKEVRAYANEIIKGGEEKDTLSKEYKDFEETNEWGLGKGDRGTEKYMKKFREWRRANKQAITVKVDGGGGKDRLSTATDEAGNIVVVDKDKGTAKKVKYEDEGKDKGKEVKAPKKGGEERDPRKKESKEVKDLKEDLKKHGYSDQDADDYIKKAKEKGKIK